jgi:rod shape determining protein RodA
VERRLAKYIDWGMLIAILALIAIGLVAIFSATHTNKGLNYGDPFYFMKRQLVSAVIGLGIGFFMLNFDHRSLGKLAWPIYYVSLALLAVVLVVGREVNGAKSWLYIGPFGMQVSELAKVGVIISLAQYLSQKEDLDTWRGLFGALLLVGAPMFLILLQPDFGTAMVFVGITFGMLFMAGAKPAHLWTLAGIGILLVLPLGYFFLLKPYQRMRLLIFLNPYQDARGFGYNIIQSMIAVGSGRLFGEGILRGRQGQLNFLPEHHTDFIFPVIAEETGFIGCMVVLGLFFYILWRILHVISESKELYSNLLCTGIFSMFLFHILINIGMTIGIMPITGIPLPFLSYGGSSLITNLISIALVLNVYVSRQKILF